MRLRRKGALPQRVWSLIVLRMGVSDDGGGRLRRKGALPQKNGGQYFGGGSLMRGGRRLRRKGARCRNGIERVNKATDWIMDGERCPAMIRIWPSGHKRRVCVEEGNKMKCLGVDSGESRWVD